MPDDSADDRPWASCDVSRRGPNTSLLRRCRPGYSCLPTGAGGPGFAHRIGDHGPRRCWRCFRVQANEGDGKTPLRFERSRTNRLSGAAGASGRSETELRAASGQPWS